METNVKGIIEKIKKEGVEKAEQEAAKILARTEEERKRILQSAREQEAQILDEAAKEAEKLKVNAQAAIRQSARDVILGLRTSIVSLFDSVVKREVGKALDADTIKKMILLLAEKFSTGENDGIEAVLSEQDKKDLEGLFTLALGKEMRAGLTLLSSKEVTKGFRIGERSSGVYYDFTDEAISEALGAYLNKGLLAILSEDNKNGK